MTLLHSVLLGIVEGVTEFLPISSTGHLILANELLGIGQTEFAKSFEIIIQLGAISAVVALYWRSFLNAKNLKKILVGFIPTGIIGFALYAVVKTYLLESENLVLWTLLLGGIAFIAFEYWHKESPEASDGIASVTYKQSLFIGLCQSVAMIPGVSRSAATILGGLLAGLKRHTVVEFSFLLAVPTMLAATGLDLAKNAGSFSMDQVSALSVGFIVSFLVALASIKFLLRFIKTHSFVPFGIYRILLAGVFFFWFIA